MEDIANNKVEELLRAQEALPLSERAKAPVRSMRAPTIPEIAEGTPAINLIDKILSGRNLIAAPEQEKSTAREAQVPAVSNNQRLIQSKAQEKVAVVEKATPAATAVPLRPLPTVPLRPLPPTQSTPSTPSPVPRAIVKDVPPPATKVPAAATASGKQLQKDELELIAKSLQSLVKHR